MEYDCTNNISKLCTLNINISSTSIMSTIEFITTKWQSNKLTFKWNMSVLTIYKSYVH